MKLLFSLVLILVSTQALAFDHSFKKWDQLLKSNVKVIRDGHASQFNYAGVNKRELKEVLKTISAVTVPEFEKWSKNQQLAFLINAYNAFTIELILKKYPKIKSIRDFDGFIRQVWSKKFFTLLGKKQNLGDLLAKDLSGGRFEDVRIHYAVNCASIGCPALREEAYVASRLDEQLAEGEKRFLTDRTRNQYAPKTNELKVSKIFFWHDTDFEKGWQSYTSLKDYFSKKAEFLSNDPKVVSRIKSKTIDIDDVPYDWKLNDTTLEKDRLK